jgi:sulfur carrier protein
MLVTINGAPSDMPDGTTVDDLIAHLGRGRSGLAVAVNDEVVPRSRWAVAGLREGDRIEVLTAAQGG